jgi:hypothetical protein
MTFGADTVALFTRVAKGGEARSWMYRGGSVRNDSRHGDKTYVFLNAKTPRSLRLKQGILSERNAVPWRLNEFRCIRFCHAEVETSKVEKIMLRLCIATAEQGR